MKSVSIQKRFNQKRIKLVLPLTVNFEPPQAVREHGAQQVANRYRQQQPAIVDQVMQTGLTLFNVQDDPSIQGLHPTGGALKLKVSYYFATEENDIYQVLDPYPKRHRISEVVVAGEKILEQLSLLSRAEKLPIQGNEIFHAAGQNIQAFAGLEYAAGVLSIEKFINRVCQFIEANAVTCINDIVDQRYLCGGKLPTIKPMFPDRRLYAIIVSLSFNSGQIASYSSKKYPSTVAAGTIIGRS